QRRASSHELQEKAPIRAIGWGLFVGCAGHLVGRKTREAIFHEGGMALIPDRGTACPLHPDKSQFGPAEKPYKRRPRCSAFQGTQNISNPVPTLEHGNHRLLSPRGESCFALTSS